MNPRNVMKMLAELAMLKYFPAGNEAVLLGLARLCGEMCRSEDEVRWLVDRMTSGLYSEWPGPAEMRACFCSRFAPKDGISAYSAIYPDGLPPSKEELAKQIAGPELLALPPGNVASADPAIEAAFKIALAANVATCGTLMEPATEEEIAAAPEWLRRMEGYE